MLHAHTVESIRAAENEAFARTPEGELMQRAAEALADVALRELGYVEATAVLVIAGPGNNGGDGLYAAGRLATRGVRVWLFATDPERVHRGGWDRAVECGATPIDLVGALHLVGERALVIDAVYGIGGTAGLRGDAATLARAAGEAGAPVIAADVPSGLVADTNGYAELGPGAQARDDAPVIFSARRTVAFGAVKLCQVMQPAAARCGDLELAPIGMDFDALGPDGEPGLRQWEASDVGTAWPVPQAWDDKYSRGVVGIDAGSDTYPGAGVLAAHGAVYACAGMVRFLGPDAVGQAVVARMPSVVTAPGQVQAWVVGSGWGQRTDARQRLHHVLEQEVPVLIDADALGQVAGLELRPECLLTPHAGELARLLEVERQAVVSDPLGHVRAAADRFGATVLLKGATQYVARPGVETVEVAVPGPGWSAQAGSGDTLAGAIGTLLAAGLATHEAAVCGASLQALTAATQPPLPPHELASRFGQTIGVLTRQR